jgi:hypothetical protein
MLQSDHANTCSLPDFMTHDDVYNIMETDFGRACYPRDEENLHEPAEKSCPCNPEMQPVAFFPEYGSWFKVLYHRPLKKRQNAACDQ